MQLNFNGLPVEIHADDQGSVWVSDYWVGEIWKFNAAGTSSTLFSGAGSPADATPDNSGGVWYVEPPQGLVRLNAADAPFKPLM